LFRTGVNLYLERQRNREGSRIQTKLVLGAVALSALPVVFLVAFSLQILNRNVEKWFQKPVEGTHIALEEAAKSFDEEITGRAQALADKLAASHQGVNFARICATERITELRLEETRGASRVLCSIKPDEGVGDRPMYTARAPIAGLGTLVV